MDDIQIKITKNIGQTLKSKQIQSNDNQMSVRQKKKELLQKKLDKKNKYRPQQQLSQENQEPLFNQDKTKNLNKSNYEQNKKIFQKSEYHQVSEINNIHQQKSTFQKQPQKKEQKESKYQSKQQLMAKINLPEVNLEEQNENQELFTQKSFQDLDFINDRVKQGLLEANYLNLTKIQHLSIQVVHEKKNVFIKSETGSGKTLAYLVPLLSRLASSEVKITREQGTQILIVCPTRELSLQCVDAALKCGKRCPNIVIGALVGGENPKHEKARLRKGVTILIGTPGRLLYHLQNTSSFKWDNINTIVFEECDRILDMGFKKDIEQIISILQDKLVIEDCQRIMVSAHINQNICSLKGLEIIPNKYQFVGFSDQFLQKVQMNSQQQQEINEERPQCHWLGKGEDTWEIPTTLHQYYTTIQEEQKLAFLFTFVLSQIKKKTIIFVSTCDEVEFFSFILQKQKFFNPLKQQQEDQEFDKLIQQDIYKLHGNIEQKDRSKTYFDFKKSKNDNGSVLISTSVASRGLDFPDVATILLFDPPDSYDDYINKVGRTARINRNGLSLLVLFENTESHNFINDIQDHLASQLNYVDSEQYFKSFQQDLYKKQRLHDKMPDKFLGLMLRSTIQRDRDIQLMSRRSYVSFVRAYGRLKTFKIKTLNLHRLAKAFGLDEATAKETQNEQYQHELKKVNREKFRNKKESKWDELRRKRKVVSERELNKMEFM